MSFRRYTMALAFVAACVALANACAAQPPVSGAADTQKQIDALRAQVAAMQKDLDEIKALLAPLRERMGGPRPGVSFDLGDRPIKGAPTARLVLVELTDYQ